MAAYEIAKVIGRLIRVLLDKKIITEEDADYITDPYEYIPY